ncbi:putative multidrug resistance protein [Dendrobium catenatum]|uniref:putative multidrug resistance protein n=1 Tax=Dendrobium catenatum TaxID=906689 RepID=UPI0009F18F9A|nr:putative multidrug resistance protein [Dendrobium catenatum]
MEVRNYESKKEEEDGKRRASIRSRWNIFMHADATDFFLMALGFLGSIGDGLSAPLMTFACSYMFNDLGSSSTSTTFIHNMNRNTTLLLYVAAGSFVLSFMEGYCWTRTGERQASRMRIRYLRAVLRQDLAYFEFKEASTTEAVNDISSNSLFIQDFLSEKLPNLIMNCTTFFAGFAVAFILMWRLALVVFPAALLLIIPGLIYGRVLLKLTSRMLTEYNKAAVIASQALSSIRTVYAFRSEHRTAAAFSSSLKKSVRIGLQQGLAKSFSLGSAGIIFTIWAFMVWYNTRLAAHDDYNGGSAYAAGISIVNGGIAFGIGLSNVKCFGEAASAAEGINEVIEKRVAMEPECEEGEELGEVRGEVEFKDVRFRYPTRPETEVISGFSLRVETGKTVALVGGSGSGKSTVISLLQRFYEVNGGEIMIDGVHIRRLKVKWLRGLMGLVSQEPALFAASIKENILFGKEDATMEEVVMAAKAANANRFIDRLPQGYDTQVGQRGVQLSGGEKQRIAIARAIIRSPKILLLDEATSALDSQSEVIVQEAFEVASFGRTTIVIAHRLSTIRNADTIAFVQAGKVVESGSHDDLISNIDGHYYSLIHLQKSQPFSNGTDNYAEAMINTSSPSLQQAHNNNKAHGNSFAYTFSPGFELLSFSSSNWSITAEEDDQDPRKQVEEAPSFWRLLMLNYPEWRQAILGCTGALLAGATYPIYGYVVGTLVSIYFLKDLEEMKEKARTYSLLLAGFSVFFFLFNLMQHYNMATMGEHLTRRIRERMLSKMLTFEVSWFDRDENSTGALCSQLAKDANMVRSLVGDRMSLIIQTLSAVTIAIAMGLLIAWRLAMVILCVQPVVIIALYVRFVILKKISKKSFKAQLESSNLVAEAISNLRTIKSFSSENRILKLFESAQAIPRRVNIGHSWVAGVGLGISQCIPICSVGLSFWYGSLLVSRHHITAKDIFQTLPIVMGTGRLIAEASALTSDLSKGASTITSIFSILNRTTLIEPENPEGRHAESLNGDIELINVVYAYPSRPNVPVLRRFSLNIKAGHSTALVGPSGSGKSTIIGLIERFYDPLQGVVRVDGEDIKSYKLRSLRRHMALVGQEPVLFAGTIEDNIAYGMDEGVSNAEIEAAAKAANAHDFICNLPNGYQTPCGELGTQLSGGQKQRIAIARAILCNPVILLLDEATSALDVQSEMVVQEALERVMVGRTTVVVAHRLSTIKDCDVIAVVERGVLVEKGTHASLMKKGPTGKYYGLFSPNGK